MAESVGYAILQLRIETLEREVKEIKKELKTQAKDNGDGFKEVNDRVDALASSQGRVEIMFANLIETTKEMKEDIKEIAASAGKDQDWRDVLKDIIKVVLIIAAYIGGSKIF